MAREIKICLACSGGGHLRQLLLLGNLYKGRPHYFVTQRTPLAESVEKESPVCYVEDVALGLLRKSFKPWGALLKNGFQSLKIILRERPDVILSSGAGSALWTLLLGRLSGARVIFMDTFAHVSTPSLTGRLVAPWASAHLIQWEALQKTYPNALLVSPLVESGGKIPLDPSRRMVFVTVGTHAPFDRMIYEVERLIQAGIINSPVKAQVGVGGHRSPLMESFEACSQAEMQHHLSKAALVITHAGTGSILSAIHAGCKVIAITRQAAHGEHYDDHQVEIMSEMVRLGAILGGRDSSELERLLGEAVRFEPMSVSISTERAERAIERLLENWFPE